MKAHVKCRELIPEEHLQTYLDLVKTCIEFNASMTKIGIQEWELPIGARLYYTSLIAKIELIENMFGLEPF